MIPKFPAFKPLELVDRAAVTAYTDPYPPYSDYNFTSLWSWNVRGEIKFCDLNGNLAVHFTDYVTNEPFYSFLGRRLFKHTATELLHLAKSEGLPEELRLLPEDSVSKGKRQSFVLKADPDNFDYILSTAELATYRGRHLRGRRNFVNRFRRQYRSTTHEFDLLDTSVQHKIEDFFQAWATGKQFTPAQVRNEHVALSRLFQAASSAPLIPIGVFVDGSLAGFSISEMLSKGFAILHFLKAAADSLVGVYPHLMQETARELAARGCRYMNYEQDLGVPGLKQAKRAYHPTRLLRKFTLTV